MILDFRVYGFPVAQGRPRAFKIPATGQIRVYDPAKSRSWKQDVKTQVLEKLAFTSDGLAEGPLEVYLGFKLQRPKSAPKRRLYPDRKPDLSNMARAVEDALKGVVYRDDSQIVRLVLEKDYDPQPGVVIRVRAMGAAEA